jgi:hypothetical protein
VEPDGGGDGSRAAESVLASRLVVLTLFGSALFGYPLLDAFNADVWVLGIPANYAYLLGAWGGLIALVALTLRGRA